MIIAVSGNIGTGKTTLVNRLSAHFGYQAEFEPIQHNPYLSHFYDDMYRWAFPLQVYFLGHRFKQCLAMRESSSGVVLDRTIYEDAEVFAKNLHRSEFLTDLDYENYLNLYYTMVKLIPKPDVVVYLRGYPEKLKDRIEQRSESERSYERVIPLSYLQNLDKCYREWIEVYEFSPVITIDINQIDLAKDEHFEKLVQNIQRQKRCVT